MRYLITFPKEKKKEIVKSLEESNENSVNLNKKKVFKPYTFAMSKILGSPVTQITTCSYDILDDTHAVWNYTVFGDTIVKEEKLLQKINNQLHRDFGEDVNATIYIEPKLNK